MLVNPCFCLAIFLTLFFTHITALGRLNHTNFRLKISSYNAATRLLDSKLRKVSVADVIGAAQIKPLDAADFMRQTPWYLKGYRWAQSSTPDESTVEWLPQGITTSHDTGENRGIVQGHSDVVVVSWNDERNKTGGATKAGQGVRVTFVRKGATDGAPTNRAYIHALLVEPFLDSSGEPDFRVLENVISGGIVWRGNWFYVTDDKSGVRVFDLGMIWKVNDGGDKVGRDENEFLGGTYPFVIPQA